MSLEIFGINFDTSNVANMYEMFSYCNSYSVIIVNLSEANHGKK
jgi:hypothetical protein